VWKGEQFMSESNERLARLVDQLRQQPGLAGSMPDPEGAVVRAALAGDEVYAIAQRYAMSEKAVWDTLGNAARAAAGQPAAQVETGGLGSDTDPGVTGGYGDTGFGSLGAEPPVAIPEEPGEGRQNEAGRN
jgi:hypothetical protein